MHHGNGSHRQNQTGNKNKNKSEYKEKGDSERKPERTNLQTSFSLFILKNTSKTCYVSHNVERNGVIQNCV